MAAAALWDASRFGRRASAAIAHARQGAGLRRRAGVLAGARATSPGARSSARRPRAAPVSSRVLTETPFRWIQWGWLE